MPLIKSISGIRGTIGGKAGEGLSPFDIVKFTSAYGAFIKKQSCSDKAKIVIGRDARVSGEMVSYIVVGTLMGSGIDVVNIGLSATPTVEIAVCEEKADGGIIITASHNPEQWNALKLLNNKGEFLSEKDGKEVLDIAENVSYYEFADVNFLGNVKEDNSYTEKHIQKIIELPLVDIELIKPANYKVAIDCVNSVGGIAIPRLLKALGVNKVVELYCEPTGRFPHNPEPLPEHLSDISKAVVDNKADIGFAVDPDVDRLAIINEDGTMFGEEYTLVAVADYVLNNKKGNTASNLSSTRALRDITEKYGGKYIAAAVGEVNVVEAMKESNSVIGGEGNGGIIYPDLHYGRDALVGIALFLTHLAKSGKKCSALRRGYPDYFISKNKIELTLQMNIDEIFLRIKEKFKNYPVNTVDGVKIEFEKEWVHLRKSNTELIVRIYAESYSKVRANELCKKFMDMF